MKVDKVCKENRLEVAVSGKLDAISSPKFEEEIAGQLEGITELTIDLGGVEYLSSAGLRALLYLHQLMCDQGRMVIRNVPPVVKDIFELTGFQEIVEIEPAEA